MANWSRDLLGVQTLSEVSSSASISSGTLTLDLSLGTIFNVTLNANVTSFSITNTPTGSSAVTIVFTADGTPRAVAWGASVLWPSGNAPLLTSTNGKKDVFSLITLDSGTNWYGFVGGQDL
jgi:hypothetical protein